MTILRLIHTDPRFGIEVRIDVIQAHNTFLRETVAKARTVDVFGIPLRLATVECLILLKILADRPIDRIDATELLDMNRERLDWDYLRAWAQKLQIATDLEERERPQ
jgi:hypothetical protein